MSTHSFRPAPAYKVITYLLCLVITASVRSREWMRAFYGHQHRQRRLAGACTRSLRRRRTAARFGPPAAIASKHGGVITSGAGRFCTINTDRDVKEHASANEILLYKQQIAASSNLCCVRRKSYWSATIARCRRGIHLHAGAGHQQRHAQASGRPKHWCRRDDRGASICARRSGCIYQRGRGRATSARGIAEPGQVAGAGTAAATRAVVAGMADWAATAATAAGACTARSASRARPGQRRRRATYDGGRLGGAGGGADSPAGERHAAAGRCALGQWPRRRLPRRRRRGRQPVGHDHDHCRGWQHPGE